MAHDQPDARLDQLQRGGGGTVGAAGVVHGDERQGLPEDAPVLVQRPDRELDGDPVPLPRRRQGPGQRVGQSDFDLARAGGECQQRSRHREQAAERARHGVHLRLALGCTAAVHVIRLPA